MIDGPLPSNVEEINSQYPEYIRRYASGQYLASMAYYLAKRQQQNALPRSILVLKPDGKFSEYFIQAFPLKKGLYGYLLLPKDRSCTQVKVIFRGTDFSEPESALINLEPWGPGTFSFAQESSKIFTHLHRALLDHYPHRPPITLDVAGHSQGGSLSQLFVTDFLKYRATTPQFDLVDTLNLTALNSPGVPYTIARQANQWVVRQMVCQKPLSVVANYGMVGGDGIQTFGMDMILAGLPFPFAEVTLLKVNKALEGNWLKNLNLRNGLQVTELFQMLIDAAYGWLGAHVGINFYAPVDKTGLIWVNTEHEYFSMRNPEHAEKILQELLNKATWSQYLSFGAKSFLYYSLKGILGLKDHFSALLPTNRRSVFSGLYQRLGSNFFNRAYQKIQQMLSSHRQQETDFCLTDSNLLELVPSKQRCLLPSFRNMLQKEKAADQSQLAATKSSPKLKV